VNQKKVKKRKDEKKNKTGKKQDAN